MYKYINIIIYIAILIGALKKGTITFIDLEAIIDFGMSIYNQTADFIESIPWHQILSFLEKLS